MATLSSIKKKNIRQMMIEQYVLSLTGLTLQEKKDMISDINNNLLFKYIKYSDILLNEQGLIKIIPEPSVKKRSVDIKVSNVKAKTIETVDSLWEKFQETMLSNQERFIVSSDTK
jgi:hypothetical protein